MLTGYLLGAWDPTSISLTSTNFQGGDGGCKCFLHVSTDFRDESTQTTEADANILYFSDEETVAEREGART